MFIETIIGATNYNKAKNNLGKNVMLSINTVGNLDKPSKNFGMNYKYVGLRTFIPRR